MIPEQNSFWHSKSLYGVWKQTLIWTINAFGVFGILVFAYGVATSFYSSPTWIDTFFNRAGAATTAAAVSLTAASVLMTENPRKVEDFSKFIVVPTVIIVSILFSIFAVFPSVYLYCLSFFGIPSVTEVPAHVYNGLTILGLSGALFRSISR